jgi:HD-like signal output (HDOD) protein
MPPFPALGTQALAIPADSDDRIDSLVKVFKSDPGLTAELLRIANSAEFGMQRRIGGIQHAIVLLGPERVHALILTVVMGSYLRQFSKRQDAHSVWAHSVAAAVIAETLAEVCRTDPRRAYAAGLMHEMGRLGLQFSVRERYLEISRMPFESIDAVNSLEKSIFGVTHCEAGAFLGRRWSFPEELCDCMNLHHEPASPGVSPLVSLTQLACRMATALGFREVAVHQQLDPALILPAKVRIHPNAEPDQLRNRVTQRVASVCAA